MIGGNEPPAEENRDFRKQVAALTAERDALLNEQDKLLNQACEKRELIDGLTAERDDLWALGLLTGEEIDVLLERFDQTEPAMQRKIVAEFARRANHFPPIVAAVLAAADHAAYDQADMVSVDAWTALVVAVLAWRAAGRPGGTV